MIVNFNYNILPKGYRDMMKVNILSERARMSELNTKDCLASGPVTNLLKKAGLVDKSLPVTFSDIDYLAKVL